MSHPEADPQSDRSPHPHSVILPPFEVDCSSWMADSVPQQTGPFVQISRVYGPPEEASDDDAGGLGKLMAGLIPAVSKSHSRPALEIQQWLDLVAVVLRQASSEVSRVKADDETKAFREAALHDLQLLTEGLDAARRRVNSAPK
jgi:hypothetical protein